MLNNQKTHYFASFAVSNFENYLGNGKVHQSSLENVYICLKKYAHLRFGCLVIFSVSILPPRFNIKSMFSLRLQTRAIFQIGSQLLLSIHLMQAVIYFHNDL